MSGGVMGNGYCTAMKLDFDFMIVMVFFCGI